MRHSLAHILFHVVVNPFYRLNTGFFLLVVLFGFGVLRLQDHLLLALFFVDHPLHLMIPWLLCTAYQAKVLVFIRNQCQLKRNEFLYMVRIIPDSVRYREVARVIFFLTLPVLIYAAFIISVSLLYEKVFAGALLLALVIFNQVVGMALVHRWFQKLPFERKYSTWLARLNSLAARRFWLVFPEWLLRKEWVLLLLTKSFSLLALAGIFIYYGTGEFDHRMLDFGVLVSFVSNSIITFHFLKYDSLVLSWRRNFPLRPVHLMSRQVLGFIPILLPELILLTNWPLEGVGLFQRMTLFIYGFSILLLLLNLQWTSFHSLQRLSIRVFWVFIAYTFLLLYGIDEWWIIGFNLAVAMYLMQTSYYEFEYLRTREH